MISRKNTGDRPNIDIVQITGERHRNRTAGTDHEARPAPPEGIRHPRGNPCPTIPSRPTQIIRNDASAGVIFSTITNNAVIHIRMPTPPVWSAATAHAVHAARVAEHPIHEVLIATSAAKLAGSSISLARTARPARAPCARLVNPPHAHQESVAIPGSSSGSSAPGGPGSGRPGTGRASRSWARGTHRTTPPARCRPAAAPSSGRRPSRACRSVRIPCTSGINDRDQPGIAEADKEAEEHQEQPARHPSPGPGEAYITPVANATLSAWSG